MRSDVRLFVAIVAVIVVALFMFLVLSGCSGDTARPSADKSAAVSQQPAELWHGMGTISWYLQDPPTCDVMTVDISMETWPAYGWEDPGNLLIYPEGGGYIFVGTANHEAHTDTSVIWWFYDVEVPAGGALYVGWFGWNGSGTSVGYCPVTYMEPDDCPPPGGGGKGNPSG